MCCLARTAFARLQRLLAGAIFHVRQPLRALPLLALLAAAAIPIGSTAAESDPVAGVGPAGQPLFLPPPLPSSPGKFNDIPGAPAPAAPQPNDAERVIPLPPIDAPSSGVAECSPLESSIWLISTRNRQGCEFNPTVSRYCGCHGWSRSSLDAFYATDNPAQLTVVFVHGNDNDAQFAIDQGLEVYRTLRAAGCCHVPVRFVIWSWPSEQVIRPYTRDVRYKSTLTDPEAGMLAPFVAGLREDVPLSLIGYSYGARIVTGALHLLAGGSLDGCAPVHGPATVRAAPIRLALIAAAMENDWLLSGGHHGCALALVDCVWMTLNNDDGALKFFPWLCDCGKGTAALGYVGLRAGAGYEEVRGKFCVMDVRDLLAHRHRLKFYLASTPIMRCLCRAAIVEVAPAPTTALLVQPPRQ